MHDRGAFVVREFAFGSRENLMNFSSLFVCGALRTKSSGVAEQAAHDFEELIDHYGVGRVFEVDEMLHDVEAGFVDGSHARTTRTGSRDAELFETLEGFANRAAVHGVAFGEIALGGQAFAGSILSAQYLVAEFGRDGRASGSRLHVVVVPAGALEGFGMA